MLDVVSLVNFDNPKRVAYLERSFGSFYSFGHKFRHFVFDSSKSLAAQSSAYKKYGVEVIHKPGLSYGRRLKLAMEYVTADHFLFLPDDFSWIFDFPLADAIQQCRTSQVAELKLTCRGMPWFSKPGGPPEPWFNGATVASGETLQQEGCLYVTRRRLFRDPHEKFSLACNLLNSQFARKVFGRIRGSAVNPGKAEIDAYIWLALSNYCVAYYRMWIPAFHFIDLTFEPDTPVNRWKVETSLIEENFALYNATFNR